MSDVVYKCVLCGEDPGGDVMEFQFHIQNNHPLSQVYSYLTLRGIPEEGYWCPLCSDTITESEQPRHLAMHQAMSPDYQPAPGSVFKCPVNGCDEAYDYSGALSIHLWEHSGSDLLCVVYATAVVAAGRDPGCPDGDPGEPDA
jgi:hypothetical protein